MYKNIVQIPSFLHVYTSERTEQNAPQRNLSCAFKSWKQRSTGKTVSFRTATAVPYVQKKNTNTHTYTQTQIEHTHTHTHHGSIMIGFLGKSVNISLSNTIYSYSKDPNVSTRTKMESISLQ